MNRCPSKGRRVLIATCAADAHAIVIDRALRDLGHDPVSWISSDLTERATASLRCSNEQPISTEGIGPDTKCRDFSFDVVWYRRPGRGRPDQTLVPPDRVYAQRELNDFHHAFWTSVCAPRWINEINAARYAQSKPAQLRAAAKVGVRIPRTLFSNDPNTIRQFVAACPNGAVYKTFGQSFWKGETYTASVFTTAISLDDLPTSRLLQACPGIYQERIDKAYEVRVTCFGDHSIAARIDSMYRPDSRQDWRAALDRLPIRPHRLPDAIEVGCRSVMRALGLQFGCMDWIVTPEGEYVFLEVNEQGQFLWIENACPKIGMLDMFCDFLINGRVDATVAGNKYDLCLSDFEIGLDEEIHRQKNVHNETVSIRIPEKYGSSHATGRLNPS